MKTILQLKKIGLVVLAIVLSTGFSRAQDYYEMVYVEGGTFQMGSDEKIAEQDEVPVHEVTLSSYYIGKFEVTQQLWQYIMENNPSHFKGIIRPVTNVSWNSCILFCNALSRKAGLEECYYVDGDSYRMDIDRNGYRLPTEAEWEFASIGGTKSKGYKFSGSTISKKVVWFRTNSGFVTHPVGKLAPNELGIYDMSGNVWEWCWDWYATYTSEPQVDPTGPKTGVLRVDRGGSFYDFARWCRPFKRDFNAPTDIDVNIGLRLVRRP